MQQNNSVTLMTVMILFTALLKPRMDQEKKKQ